MKEIVLAVFVFLMMAVSTFAAQQWDSNQDGWVVFDEFMSYYEKEFNRIDAYIGQEDQGQMSGWYIMGAIGLFQTDGGCRAEPIYEIGSPLFEKVVIDLGRRYGRGKTFTIEAKNAFRKNKYVQKATLNGKALNRFYFPASELLKGGSLVLGMGDTPDKNWEIVIDD